MNTLANKFRILREQWYYVKLHRRAHEREWETESQELCRDNENKMVREIFDDQTERIIEGEDLPIAPLCDYDIFGYKKR